ncbi:MAG: hypothetical protein KVP17_003839 [Porospora cf. gigantea B]|uniref:uncharacterized protein n=1 Tax=Porospora cf. gigantea B TaxID=2853592 RepID=UPI003571E1EA|nr:MAG: hypothetical protein KVP17_003839 [Porospora cf. gigantea B]
MDPRNTDVSTVFVVTFLAGMQNYMFVLFLCCVLENRYFVSLATIVATTTQLVIMCAVNTEAPSKTRVYATLLLSPTATIAPALRYLMGVKSTPLHELSAGYVYLLQSAFICLLFTLTLIAWPDRGQLRLRWTPEVQESQGWFNLEFVSVTYASNTADQNSVYQFNLAVEAGALAYVVGDSKCGVRAVHELATGILRPSAGDVVCLGKAVLGTNYECGFFDANIRLMNHMTVGQHLRMVAVFKGLPGSSEASGVRALLVLFGIQKLADEDIRALSWASRKIVALACSLIGWPRVVVWHQPFEGLDPFFISRCMRVIDHLRNDDVAILITTKALRRLPVHVSSRSNTKLVFLRDGYTQFQTNDIRSLVSQAF